MSLLHKVFGFSEPTAAAKPSRPAPAAPAPEPAADPVLPHKSGPHLSEAVRKELHAKPAPQPEPPKRPMKRYEEHGPAPICEEDVRTVVSMDPPKISEELREEIARLDAEWQRIREFINQHDAHSAIRYAKTEAARLQAAIQAGDLEAASRVQRLPREAVMDDYSVKRKLAKAHRRELEARAWELIKPLVAQVAKSAGRIADELEAQEKKVCQKFDRPFVPSITLAVLGQLTWRIESYTPRSCGPAAMLAFFEPKH